MSMQGPDTRQQRGFNVIELMVTVAVVGILAAVALPSFADAIARNRIAAQANDFAAAVNYARTEAIRRNSPAGVCASSDDAVCGGTWDDGWIVWATNATDATLIDVLRVGEFNASDTFAPVAATQTIAFNDRGALTGTADSFVLEPSECDAGKPFVRQFTFALTGSMSMTQESCE